MSAPVEVPKKLTRYEKKKVAYDKVIAAMKEASELFASKKDEELFAKLDIVLKQFETNQGAKQYSTKLEHTIEDFIFHYTTKENDGQMSTRKVVFRDIWEVLRDFALDANICYNWDKTTGEASEYDSD